MIGDEIRKHGFFITKDLMEKTGHYLDEYKDGIQNKRIATINVINETLEYIMNDPTWRNFIK